MKNIILIVSLFIVSLNASLTVQQIENMVVKIHKKRVGVSLKILERTQSPFILAEGDMNTTKSSVTTEIKDRVKITLHAIMSDKAYINDGWKKVDDSVMGYTLKYIGKKGVVLRYNNNIKKIFLHKKSNDLIKIEER